MKKTLSWNTILEDEKNKPYFNNILKILTKERKSGITIYPPQKDIFNAFRFTEFNKIKVVILGQDPYSKIGQSHGLAFSVSPNIAIPPSLLNIYKELEISIPYFIRPNHGCLKSWAKQGVLLLNSVLTVRAGQPHSHANIGWEIFTDKVITLISKKIDKVAFLLWGLHAQKKELFINKHRHFILKASHPSPLSAHRGFFHCNHFSLTNKWLEENGKKPINWIPFLL